jgi:predicted GNAT superfamily acetyltransferase
MSAFAAARASAEGWAAAAADRAGVRIRPLVTIEEFLELDAVFTRVWGSRGGRAIAPVEMTQALHFAGNYIVGAFDGGRMVGGSHAFLGRHEGRLHLHSHITGVVPELQARAIGYAIKLHQRAWALANGVEEVIWTFDPLIRRNAYFNLSKLGARVTGYHANFYGDLADDINAGDESDRAVIDWALASPEVEAALAGPGAAAADDRPATVILDPARTVIDFDPSDDRPLSAWVPEDIVAVRRSDPGDALAWRRALRETFGRAVSAGWAATAMSRDGWYTLLPPKSSP